jgi:phosphatidylglycerophosphatase A
MKSYASGAAPIFKFVLGSGSMNNSPLQKLKRFVVAFIITAGGSGFTPRAPGTAGTVVGVLLVYLIRDWTLNAQGILFLGIFLIGWWASIIWSHQVQQTDSQKIVIDEVLGYMVAMATLPTTAGVLILQFITFRIFDSLKPFPIRNLDRWGKGFEIGPAQSFMVIFDDLLAGLLSLGLYFLLHHFGLDEKLFNLF